MSQMQQMPQMQQMEQPNNIFIQQPSKDSPNLFMKSYLFIKNYLIKFIKEHYGFVLIITLLIILLYIRYVEVTKKKKKICKK